MIVLLSVLGMSLRGSLNKGRGEPMEERVPLDRKRKGRLIVGIVGVLVSIGYIVEAQQLPFGTMAQPGAAAFPTVVGIGFALASLLTIWEALRTEAVTGSVDLPRGEDLRRLLGLVAAFAAYAVTLPYLGQIIASTAFAIVALRLLSDLSWIRTVVYAIAISAATYLLFVVLLNVRMPDGLLGF